MASLYPYHASASPLVALEVWNALPAYRRWYYFFRVWLIVNKARIPALIALVLAAAGLLTYALGQNILYGLLMMALGAALVLIIIWTRPRC
jgi:hypothetical protein